MTDHVAHAETEVSASPQQVWEALTDPDAIAAYMLGSRVETDWEEGSAITWSGEYDGRPYQDKGEILEVVEDRRLRVTHYSPLSGEDDVPESYHTIDYRLEDRGATTVLTLDQDGNDSPEQAEQFSATWQLMLDQLKEYVEAGHTG